MHKALPPVPPDEHDPVRDEQDRQARIRRAKAADEQAARDDDTRRRALLDQHLRHAAARRLQAQQEATALEDARRRALEEHRRREHERRISHTRQMQQWRHDHIRRQLSQSTEKEEERTRALDQRRARTAAIAHAVLRDGPFAACLTVQTPEYLAWKRRYALFDLPRGTLSLYRNQQDLTRLIDAVQLDGCVASIHEWFEGFEELEAIPHSFAVKFVDGRTWLMFADSEHDKDRLLVLLSEASGITL